MESQLPLYFFSDLLHPDQPPSDQPPLDKPPPDQPPPSTPLISLEYCVKVHPLVHTLTATNCIPSPIWLQTSSSVDDGQIVYSETHKIMTSRLVPLSAPSASSNLLDYSLQVHLSIYSIRVSRCFSNYTQLSTVAKLTIHTYMDRLRY